MYFKVALMATSLILLSACSNSLGAKPKAPNKNLGIEVVEEVPTTTPATSEQKSTATAVKKKSSVKKAKKKTKPYLKPEPFSLESQESDPELLGPQTTLDTPLSRTNDTVEEDDDAVEEVANGKESNTSK